MPRFLVLPRESDDTFAHLSPAEMQEIIDRYIAWTAHLEERGRLESSEKLEDGTGRVLRRGDDGLSITDGPFTEVKEVVGGYWIVTAADFADACALVEGHPHLAWGTLEIRRIEEHGDAAAG
jgi:hypothetical protein